MTSPWHTARNVERQRQNALRERGEKVSRADRARLRRLEARATGSVPPRTGCAVTALSVGIGAAAAAAALRGWA